MLTKRRFLLASAAAAATAATAKSTYTFLRQCTSTDGAPKGRAAFLSNFPSSFNFGGGKDESRGNNKDLYHKARILRMLVSNPPKGRKFILFTRTQHDADQLTHFLKRTAECEALHGRDTSQTQTSLARFRDGDLKLLVASDDFASDDDDGLRNPNVYSLIAIHFDVPNSSEAFVRRSGITGRVPNIVVHQTDDVAAITAIERDVGGDHVFSHLTYGNTLADRAKIFLDDTLYANIYHKFI